MSISGRSSFSCIQMTLSCFASSLGAAAGVSFASGFCTRYLAIFFSILMCAMSEFPVVAFFQRIVEIRGGMHLAVVFDLLVAPRLDLRAVLQREHVDGVLEIILFHQHALERLRIEAERGAALQSLLVRIQIDALELF